MLSTTLYVYLGVYIAILLLVSFSISRRQNSEDFLISSRNRGGWQILFSKFAGAIGAGYFITYTGFAYEYGTDIFMIVIGAIFGYLAFGLWAAPRIHRDSKKQRFYTMGDYVFSRTKSLAARNVTNVVSNIIIFGWLIVGVIGGAKIIHDFGLLSYELAVFVTIAVVLMYILLAGFKAVIITDFIQAFVILVLLVLVTFSITASSSFASLFSVDVASVSVSTIIGFFIFGFLAIFSYSNMYQLCYAAKSRRTLMAGLSFAIVPVLLASTLLLFIGLFMASQVSGLDSGLVFTQALKDFLPAALLPLGIVLFFAGIMSSADTNIYAITSHYIFSKRELPSNPVRSIRKMSVVLIIVSTIIALVFRDIVDVSIVAASISVALSFAMIYLFFGGRNKTRFMCSIVASLIGLVLGLLMFGIEPTVILLVTIGGMLGLLCKSRR